MNPFAIVVFLIIGVASALVTSQVGWQLGVAAGLFSFVLMPFFPKK